MNFVIIPKKKKRVLPLAYHINRDRMSLKNLMGYEEETKKTLSIMENIKKYEN